MQIVIAIRTYNFMLPMDISGCIKQIPERQVFDG